MDFTLDVLKQLLNQVNRSNPKDHTFLGFLQNPSNKKQVILRHDIDRNPAHALKIAQIEKDLNIKATYYFRIHPSIFKSEIIKEIADLGHEIGYHYEDFTKFHGNPEKAIESFKKNLAEFRKIYPVKTICMDGKPLSIYNNLDLWKYYNYSDLGIIGEPFLDLDYTKILYLTDTGRGWNMVKYSVRDKVNENFHYHNVSSPKLIEDIKNGILPDQIMLTIHPQRWHDHRLLWIKELVLQRLKNVVKWGLIQVRKEKSA